MLVDDDDDDDDDDGIVSFLASVTILHPLAKAWLETSSRNAGVSTMVSAAEASETAESEAVRRKRAAKPRDARDRCHRDSFLDSFSYLNVRSVDLARVGGVVGSLW